MHSRSLDSLGPLQRTVMETVWKLEEATVNQVRDHINRDKPLAYTTVLSVMQKLEKGGWLHHRKEGRTYVYSPVSSRSETGTSALRNLIQRVFSGDPLTMFQHLLNDPKLTEKELAELQKMITDKQEENSQ